MLDRKRIDQLLSRGMPDKQWEGEPMLGAWYTEEEIETAVKAIRDSMDWTKGFGFFCEEITKFEDFSRQLDVGDRRVVQEYRRLLRDIR